MVGLAIVAQRIGEPPGGLEIVIAPAHSSVALWRAKKSRSTRLAVASQVTALAPFSQNSKEEPRRGSDHAHPGRSKPSGWLTARSARVRHLITHRERHGAQGAPAAGRAGAVLHTIRMIFRHYISIAIRRTRSSSLKYHGSRAVEKESPFRPLTHEASQKLGLDISTDPDHALLCHRTVDALDPWSYVGLPALTCFQRPTTRMVSP